MRSDSLPLPQLCLVTDPTQENLVAQVESALRAGVTMVQLRGHGLTAARMYELALQIRLLCNEYKAIFIVNDRLDVGLAVQADGFQLGQQSLPLDIARKLVGERALLGVSVHTLEEARRAVADGADFLLVGTIFPSASHPGEPGCGPQFVQTIKQSLPEVPALAIGGITADNVRVVQDAGADGVAVITAILASRDVYYATRELCREMGVVATSGEGC